MQLIKLALETGYHHGDFHASNFLINDEYNGYYREEETEKKGRVLIIDFGYVVRIPVSKQKQIKQLAHAKQYVNILELLYQTPRNGGLSLIEYPGLFKWVTEEPEISEEQMNADLDELNRQIKEGDRQRADESKVHGSKIPKLPLSKADIAKFSLFERGFRKRQKLRGVSSIVIDATSIYDN